MSEDRAALGRVSLRAVLLGVTPEIATMRWPHGTRLLAVDRNLAMIEKVWPRHQLAGAAAVCAHWTAMPLGNETCDAVIGDGCLIQLSFPTGYDLLNQEVHRVLKRGGSFIMRAFIRSDKPEPLATVFDDLRAGRIGNFHVFKWRLAMALYRDRSVGVRLADIWNAWHDAVPEPASLAQKLNWPLEAVHTIDAYRGFDTCYTFPRLEEFRRVMSVRFAEDACCFPNYELGERCPTLLFRRR